MVAWAVGVTNLKDVKLEEFNPSFMAQFVFSQNVQLFTHNVHTIYMYSNRISNTYPCKYVIQSQWAK